MIVDKDVYTWGSNVEGCLGRHEEVRIRVRVRRARVMAGLRLGLGLR
jgi:hypothetical protein